MYSCSMIQLPVFSMKYLGLSFASLESSLSLLFSSWGESEENQMVSVSVKGHELWRVSEMMRSSLIRVVFLHLKVR